MQVVPAGTISSEYQLSKQETVFITQDEQNIAKPLSEELEQHGFTVNIVENLPEDARQVVLLTGLQNVKDVDEAIAINRKVFQHFKRIAAHIAKQGGCVCTVQDTGGNFGLQSNPGIRAWLGGITGLVKTAAREWPKVRFKAIDIFQRDFPPEVLAKRIAKEIIFGDHEIEIGLPANDERIKLQLTADAQIVTQLKHITNPLLLVSGGARGITASCLLEYAKVNPARFVLFGRTNLTDEDLAYKDISDKDELRKVLITEAKKQDNSSPKVIEKKLQNLLAIREIKATLQALNKLGSEAKYVSVDIQDQQQLTNVINEIRSQQGNIDGIIHAAGVLADKLIVDKTIKQFNTVFDTKVIGLKNILTATAQDRLSLIITFSSVAARFGNEGQADYAMANEVLNKVMQAEKISRGEDCLIKSINWGAWDSGMVNPSLKKLFEQRGIKLISTEEGAKLFVAELMAALSPVEIILGQPLEKADVRTEITINAIADAYLKSHTLQDSPIVPTVLGFEWMLRVLAAQRLNPCDYDYTDLKILKGITLNHFDTQPYHFSVHHQASNLVIKHQETRCYTVTINKKMRDDQTPFVDTLTILKNTTPWPFPANQLYNGLLFHGPHFYAIESLEYFSNLGGSAILSGMLAHKNWPSLNWCIDVVLFDGIMQVAGLWCFANNNNLVMPTGIDAIRLYQSGVIKGKVHCVIECNVVNKRKVLINAVCFDAQNKKIVEMRDIMMIAFG